MRVGSKHGANILTTPAGVGQVGPAGLTVSFLGHQALPGVFYAPMVARFTAGNRYEWWAGLENNGLATVSIANTAGSGIGGVTASAVGNLQRRPVRITFTIAGTTTGSPICLYVDGVLAGVSSLTGTLTMQPLYPMSIGRRTDNVSTDLEGDVRDVQVWDRVLSPTEVLTYHLNGIRGDEYGLAAWYPLLVDAKDYALRSLPTPVTDSFVSLTGPTKATTDTGQVWLNPADAPTANPITVANGQWQVPGAYTILGFAFGSSDVRVAFTLTAENTAGGHVLIVTPRWLSGAVMAQANLRSDGVSYNGVTYPSPIKVGGRYEFDVVGRLIVARLDGVEIMRAPLASAHPTFGVRSYPAGASTTGFAIKDLVVSALGSPPLDATPTGSPRPQLALQR